ncbi:hypothetical protein HMSSN139_59870 [Paenibacillus sp. HMSSN-139]|nr:hypothetical protein HMSSN139_59870 [Paenibacillus sp. HMSSN-139]
MQLQTIFNTEAPNKSTRIIGGECSGILNWNDIRMPHMYKLYKVLLLNHWIADEIPMAKDAQQFALLDSEEQRTFKINISLLAVLDSMQTMFVGDVKRYFTDSSLEAISAIIGQQEVVHNQSYSYVLSSIVSEQEQKEISNTGSTTRCCWTATSSSPTSIKTSAMIRRRSRFRSVGRRPHSRRDFLLQHVCILL